MPSAAYKEDKYGYKLLFHKNMQYVSNEGYVS